MDALPEPAAVISGGSENPKISEILSLAEQLDEVDVVVAIGGGSVIDAAKGILAYVALGRDSAPLMRHLRDGEALPAYLDVKPLISVPTTSGSGSEVTRWGTIWGDDQIKYSVNDPALYPSDSILDPKLCVTMPKILSIGSNWAPYLANI